MDRSGRAQGDAEGEGANELRGQVAALLPDMRAFARFLLRDRSAADDLLGEAVVRALGALHQFEPGTNLKAWLFTIVRNAFYEGARRRKREASALQRQALVSDSVRPAQEQHAAVRDLQAMLWTLPPLLREALILVGAQEMTYEEAAVICGVPVGTVKARVSRGRTALAAAVRRAEGKSDGMHEASDT